MRMLMNIRMPHEEFNEAVRDGSAGDMLQRIVAEAKPECIYFTELDGQRGAIMVVNVDDPSQIPRYAEPWFLKFDADVEFKIAMVPEDIQNAGLGDLGRKWG
jgi:hypothetical protein